MAVSGRCESDPGSPAKRKRRKWTGLFTDAKSDQWPDPAVKDPRETLDLQQEVRAVIDEIPEKYRTVLVLRDLEKFSTSEIAAILDRKEATIRWRLAEARLRFQSQWQRRQGLRSTTDVPVDID